MRRRAVVLLALGLTVALLLARVWPSDDEPVLDRGGTTAGTQSGPWAESRDYPVTPKVDQSLTSGLATAEGSSVSPSQLPATAEPSVRVTVTAPAKLFVGDMNDLVVGLGPNAGVREVGFSVQFDPNVLQVRAGSEGDWAAGAGAAARFASDISSGEDRVQIRSEVVGATVGMAGGSVALIRFQGVAPGTTSVLISDVVVKDPLGRWVAAAVSAPSLQMTVDSVPPPQPLTIGQSNTIPAEPDAGTTQLGD